jgi:hypothetical protein
MLKTAMHYPCNYGYIPHTLCGDGDTWPAAHGRRIRRRCQDSRGADL